MTNQSLGFLLATSNPTKPPSDNARIQEVAHVDTRNFALVPQSPA